uniref:Uncharacterized protein LOC106774881 n=1 Tax=Rhizophora mucronata TaxID=61149 RepID=A0A2P2L851_RHIMU
MLIPTGVNAICTAWIAWMAPSVLSAWLTIRIIMLFR